jgi:hypothetical protein
MAVFLLVQFRKLMTAALKTRRQVDDEEEEAATCKPNTNCCETVR